MIKKYDIFLIIVVIFILSLYLVGDGKRKKHYVVAT